MSGGGLSQVLGVGIQDAVLTSDASITYFKSSFKQYTPFVLQATLPALTANSGEPVAWTQYLWFELTCPPTKVEAYQKMIGNVASLTTQASTIPAYTLYLPLPFWFALNYGNALPIVSMQFNICTIEIMFESISNLYITSDNLPLSASTDELSATLYIDYIFLNTAERDLLGAEASQYLIGVWQHNGLESGSTPNIKPQLTFNHPVIELFWFIRLDANKALKNWFDYTNWGTSLAAWNGGQTVASSNLLLNGNERFSSRAGQYHNYVSAYQNHSRCPAVGVYSYSFALYPELATPTGSQNFSRIDTAILALNLNTANNVGYKLGVYARSWNILRVRGGQSGTVFAS
ncbi:group II dsDNA viruses VP [Gonapodya prolifera JEL478]|uniref:Group II dsDNA viruses VP n=1 Tax=Gonapodya prolifera (strain JEL478) TaxID=1344416 RepID=A0A139A9J7_GONPJ|nr:group II dsDNA viruses VP [Gonapodya prolifera JEL478]|eukprot:KXS13073.1 group II dsDNA viruses VP [Gonapodya prolifera JEL478]